MIGSADEFTIVKNAVGVSRGFAKTINWGKVQEILLQGTTHAGSTSSIKKCRELGVNPYSRKWVKESEV